MPNHCTHGSRETEKPAGETGANPTTSELTTTTATFLWARVFFQVEENISVFKTL
jgi:hypothetical protein